MLDHLFSEDLEAENGIGELLSEIRKISKHLPPELADDITFGAIAVVRQEGCRRSKRILRLERWATILSGIVSLIALAIVTLHAGWPWLEALLEAIF